MDRGRFQYADDDHRMALPIDPGCPGAQGIETSRRCKHPGVLTLTQDPGCPGSKGGETLDQALFPLRVSLLVPGCPRTVHDGCSGRATSIGCPHVVPGCPGNRYEEIPDDQDNPWRRSLFPGRVTPSFSQGIPREHLVGQNLIILIGLPRS
jgi:hypothetical protein